MKALKERILKDGCCLPGGILKVDKFINHQMDPILMKSMAVEFVRRFANKKINKIVTIEASGIAPAILVGYLLELPVVFAKKRKPSTSGFDILPNARIGAGRSYLVDVWNSCSCRNTHNSFAKNKS